MAALAEFPQEVLDTILSSPDLSHHDRANIRLVNRFFHRAVSPHVFRRIHISCLKTDRDAFLAIANSPHLAPLVKELVWDEVSVEYPPSRPLPMDLVPVTDRDDETSIPEVLSLMERTAQEIPWLPWVANSPQSRASPEELQEFNQIFEEFLPIFVRAVEKLSNLRCITSTAMSSDRVLCDGSYPLTLNNFLILGDSHRRRDGFLKFVLPTIARGGTSIDTLRWIDRDVGQTIALVVDTDPTPMTSLRSIDLCFAFTPYDRNTLYPYRERENVVKFSRWMHAAEALEELCLCFEDEWGNSDEKVTAIVRYLLMASKDPQLGGWKNLRTLAVHGSFSAEWVAPFVAAHASTIRRVLLCGVNVTHGTIDGLSKIEDLRLDYLEIRQEGFNDDDDLADRARLLKYINKESTEVPWEYCRNPPNDPIATDIWEENNNAEDDMESLASSDSQDARRAESPYWCWGRYHTPGSRGFQVYYWPVPENIEGSFPTEVWRFTSRDGTIQYGAEPYDWFEDWDTGEGDVAEPVPYGQDFLQELRDSARKGYEIGCYFGGAWDQVFDLLKPPEGAILYNVDEDPFVRSKELRWELM